jgi:hypothetical protein
MSGFGGQSGGAIFDVISGQSFDIGLSDSSQVTVSLDGIATDQDTSGDHTLLTHARFSFSLPPNCEAHFLAKPSSGGLALSRIVGQSVVIGYETLCTLLYSHPDSCTVGLTSWPHPEPKDKWPKIKIAVGDSVNLSQGVQLILDQGRLNHVKDPDLGWNNTNVKFRFCGPREVGILRGEFLELIPDLMAIGLVSTQPGTPKWAIDGSLIDLHALKRMRENHSCSLRKDLERDGRLYYGDVSLSDNPEVFLSAYAIEVAESKRRCK